MDAARRRKFNSNISLEINWKQVRREIALVSSKIQAWGDFADNSPVFAFRREFARKIHGMSSALITAEISLVLDWRQGGPIITKFKDLAHFQRDDVLV